MFVCCECEVLCGSEVYDRPFTGLDEPCECVCVFVRACVSLGVI
jgi:hypothetical protein